MLRVDPHCCHAESDSDEEQPGHHSASLGSFEEVEQRCKEMIAALPNVDAHEQKQVLGLVNEAVSEAHRLLLPMKNKLRETTSFEEQLLISASFSSLLKDLTPIMCHLGEWSKKTNDPEAARSSLKLCAHLLVFHKDSEVMAETAYIFKQHLNRARKGIALISGESLSERDSERVCHLYEIMEIVHGTARKLTLEVYNGTRQELFSIYQPDKNNRRKEMSSEDLYEESLGLG